ncbi:hypothetical protein UPYG_G00071330 [Umbra pygmaea]|uniref:Alkylated DNA repair protein AlkB homologue 8 N-terminal domain-containing protein n=1 Tax=Umbra pygmaea TaxID=75934 RepID=A0ABD0XBN5_UMBPY
MEKFVTWCDDNHLQLNVTKNKGAGSGPEKEKGETTGDPVPIRGVGVDLVDDHKYLGVHIGNKLDWTKNTEVLYRKGQSCFYFLRRLRSFISMMRSFYESVVAGAFLYAVDSLETVSERRRLSKIRSIMDSSSHSLTLSQIRT